MKIEIMGETKCKHCGTIIDGVNSHIEKLYKDETCMCKACADLINTS